MTGACKKLLQSSSETNHLNARGRENRPGEALPKTPVPESLTVGRTSAEIL